MATAKTIPLHYHQSTGGSAWPSIGNKTETGNRLLRWDPEKVFRSSMPVVAFDDAAGGQSRREASVEVTVTFKPGRVVEKRVAMEHRGGTGPAED
jgi:hypothetical protein